METDEETGNTTPQSEEMRTCIMKGVLLLIFPLVTGKQTDIRSFTRSPAIGQTFSYWCRYPADTRGEKFICRGEDSSLCEHLVSTTQRTSGRFSMKDDTQNSNISVTVMDVRREDTGTYWCGVERRRSKIFFNQLVLTVVEPTKPTLPVSAAGTPGSLQVLITVAVCGVVLLLSVLLGILIYRRHFRNKRSATAVQHNKEEDVYEEIQNPDPGQEVSTIYVTTGFPTSPPSTGSLHYSTLDFQMFPGAAGAPVIRSPFSACEYSAVKEAAPPPH